MSPADVSWKSLSAHVCLSDFFPSRSLRLYQTSGNDCLWTPSSFPVARYEVTPQRVGCLMTFSHSDLEEFVNFPILLSHFFPANFKPCSWSQQHSAPIYLSEHRVELHILKTYCNKANIQKCVLAGISHALLKAQWVQKEKNHSKLTGFTGPHSRGTYSSSRIASEKLAQDRCYINLRDSWYCTAS